MGWLGRYRCWIVLEILGRIRFFLHMWAYARQDPASTEAPYLYTDRFQRELVQSSKLSLQFCLIDIFVDCVGPR